MANNSSILGRHCVVVVVHILFIECINSFIGSWQVRCHKEVLSHVCEAWFYQIIILCISNVHFRSRMVVRSMCVVFVRKKKRVYYCFFDIYVVLPVAARAMTLNTIICVGLSFECNVVIPHHSRHFLWEWVLHKPTVFVVCVNKLLFDFVCHLHLQKKIIVKACVCGL